MNLKSELNEKFNWHLVNKFSPVQQGIFLNAGQVVLSYLDQQTSGDGKSWMARNIGKVNFVLGGLPQKVVTMANHGVPTSVTFLTNWIWLEPTFEQGRFPIQHIIHELAHVIDNKVGSHHHAFLPIWFGGGPSDQLTKFLGGKPNGLRWRNGTSGIKKSRQWIKTDPATQSGYGNHSTADYFAEVFAWVIIDPSHIKLLLVRKWFKKFLISFD